MQKIVYGIRLNTVKQQLVASFVLVVVGSFVEKQFKGREVSLMLSENRGAVRSSLFIVPLPFRRASGAVHFQAISA